VSGVSISPLVESVFIQAAQQFKPPPRLSISEWANRNFVLSSEDSAEPGRYRTSRAPYQREILDAIGEPEVEEIVLCCAAQTVKTVAIKIWIAYFVKEDPSSILFLLPGLDLARRVSRQRLAPMFRDVPILRGLLEEGANKAGNATLEKSFPGGVLFLVGANSPAGLSSVPVRIVFADEVNRFPASAGSEGSPLELAEMRTATFWNRKKVKCSTPTDSHGAITQEYEKTDMRRYEVPCPGCSEVAGELDGFQVLDFKNLIIDLKDPTAETTYACRHCGMAITEESKTWMLANGRWVALRPEVKTRRGYQISALYSPFFTWADVANKWRSAMEHREDKNLLRVFFNTVLAQPYDDEAEVLESSELMSRREDYPCPVPDGVAVLTAAVDVQGDRIELLVRGWGKGQESWLIDRKIFEGDPSKLEGVDVLPAADNEMPRTRPSPWQRLGEYLDRAYYLHARGVRLPISCTMVDSGHQAAVVYEFCKTRAGRGIFPVKGVSGFGKAPVTRPAKTSSQRARLHLVAVDVLKSTLHQRLRIGTPGAGYLHFSREFCDEAYFKQLTAEQLKRKQVRGYPMRYWEKLPGRANEALDLEVYAYAAFLRMSDRPEEMLAAQREALIERGKFAARSRRAKVDPRQRDLLAQAPAAEPDALQTSAGTPPDAAPADPDEGLGANEHKIAEQLDDAAAPTPAPPEKPRIAMRPPKWR
jgi:phage terminase large subunit GpA-like protein